MIEGVEEVVRASQSDASSGEEEEGVVVEVGKWCSLTMQDINSSSGFGYEFRALESATISRSSNTEENSNAESADTYKQQVGVSEISG